MQFGKRTLDLSQPRVMGILNVTPDSFSDGGCYWRVDGDISPALRRAEAMVTAGADFIDIGGESTRPGAACVGEQEEMDRVLPVLEAIASNLDVIVSLDTSSPRLIAEGAARGAGLINDVRALSRVGAVEALANTNLPVCLMHMQGAPQTMQQSPHYGDVVAEVRDFFDRRVDVLAAAGIAAERVIVDPGFGFGKTDAHNLALLKNLSAIAEPRFFRLVGLSRKSMLGRLLGRDTDRRLAGSLALAQYALDFGANILRVHDVEESVDLIKLFNIVRKERNLFHVS